MVCGWRDESCGPPLGRRDCHRRPGTHRGGAAHPERGTQTLPALYTLAATSPGDFNYVPGGTTDYTTAPDYSAVTGLGSPVINKLIPGLVGDGTAAAATELTVTAQPPGNITTGSAFGLTVVAEDAAGTMDPNYNGPVTISLGNNPAGGTLGGTVTATAIDGVATFTI